MPSGAAMLPRTTTWGDLWRFRRELARRIKADVAGIWIGCGRSTGSTGTRAERDPLCPEQVEALGAISSDRTVSRRAVHDPLGDRGWDPFCFGARVTARGLCPGQAFGEAAGSRPEVMVSDDGILFRFLEPTASRRWS